jgi:hypothetical protein
MGGLEVLSRHGLSFYSVIGKKGQSTMRAKYTGMASMWGKLGGRPKKINLMSNLGGEGKKG